MANNNPSISYRRASETPFLKNMQEAFKVLIIFTALLSTYGLFINALALFALGCATCAGLLVTYPRLFARIDYPDNHFALSEEQNKQRNTFDRRSPLKGKPQGLSPEALERALTHLNADRTPKSILKGANPEGHVPEKKSVRFFDSEKLHNETLTQDLDISTSESSEKLPRLS